MGDEDRVGEMADAVQPAVDFVNEVKAEKQRERFDADVKDILGFFSKAVELKGLPEKLQRGFIETHAQDDPDFNTAFENKASNPKAWEVAKEKARDALTEMVSELPGSKVRTDVKAALASVDGDTGTPASYDRPSPVKLMNMPDWEWKQYKEEQERLAER